ncbi:terminase large subunit domain-containing protein [Laribacter hongkongensis]
MQDTPFDPRHAARALYWQGWRIARIAEALGLRPATVHSWKRREDWDAVSPVDRVNATLEARLQVLIGKDKKEGCDYKEIDLLGRQLERLEKLRHRQREGGQGGGRSEGGQRQKQSASKNLLTDEQVARLKAAFRERLFGYQKHWLRAGHLARIRNILKSRQIGATWYFALEALLDALETGRNQIFLSASKRQALQFQSYQKAFVSEVCDIELKGSDKILFGNGAELIFLGTSSRTAQSYHGNLYMDEYFWTPKFAELRKVAAGMASQKRWRQTYFSTPSTLAHEAYPFWSGKRYNAGRPASEQIAFDLSHKALAGGLDQGDGQWRQIVTIHDALRQGCDLFDLDALRLENSPDEFRQLFECEFIDDGKSVFPLSMLHRCMVDSMEAWPDYNPFTLRPLGHREVWIGYDPSESGDSAAMVVVAPPAVPDGPFRLLECRQFRGLDYSAQAQAIREATERYRVTHIAIDRTGLGSAVHQLVTQFFPAAMGYQYSLDLKTRMVLKGLDVIRHGRLQFDAGAKEIAASFMAIHRSTTGSGLVTFVADRSEAVSHADIAWATLQTLYNEPLEGRNAGNAGFVEIYS